ncbi:MAG: amidohydrolase family protein [Armatimonadetes bacterium]|nr:amidohydrolase family protein [Armatimonadota bacterium]
MKSLAILGLALVSLSQAQSLRPSLTTTAIVGARIQVSPTQVIEKGSVLMRGGRIIAVGESVVVPPGAIVTDGKGLTVYAGFIDAFTTKGLGSVKLPRHTDVPSISEDVVTQMRVAYPEQTGLGAAQLYDPDNDQWKNLRAGGFTAALVAPSGSFINGPAAVFNTSGKAGASALLQDRTALFADIFGPGSRYGGEYPGTALGRYAGLRQALLDSNWMAEASQADSGERPAQDPFIGSLANSISQGMPLVFSAGDISNIQHTIRLAKELGAPALLVDAGQGYKNPGILKGASVILKLAFGKEPIPTAVQPPGGAAKPAEAAPVPENPDEDPLPIKQDAERNFVDLVRNPSVLAKQGIPFAFSADGVPGTDEFFKNLRRAVKEGLSQEDAIAGLTTNAASLLKLKGLGRIEAGAIANLTVWNGSLFDDKSSAAFVYIDGIKLDPKKKRLGAPLQFDFDEE